MYQGDTCNLGGGGGGGGEGGGVRRGVRRGGQRSVDGICCTKGVFLQS